jgi:N-acetylmuramoyl-L-alanine amidase
VLHFQRIVSAGCLAVLVLAGCQTAPRLSAPVTPLSDGQPLVVAPTPIEPVVEKPVPAPVTLPAPPVEPPVAPIALRPTLPSSTTNGLVAQWVAWENWSMANGSQKPQPKSTHATHSFELHTANGIIAITVGSRLAYWRGLAYWLGFAPQLIRGQPYIHALDAKKSFLPLLSCSGRNSATNRVLVIDPGHGGQDPGTRCVVNGHFEKEFTLDWALRLRNRLADCGWKVYLTRTNDVDLPLLERVKLAEQYHADVFISLHFNSGPSVDRSGVAAYCLTPSGMPSSLVRGFADDAGIAYPNNEYDEENLQLALRLHQKLVEATGRNDQGVGRARFMGVLRGQKRPAVLLEGGYLSNPQEARLIADGHYRQKLADAVVKALDNWGNGKGQ